MKKLLPVVFLLQLSLAHGQIGDKSDRHGEVQTNLVPRELIPPSPARTAEEEMKTFKLQPALHLECVASDPLIQEPIVAEFDPDGRLWVVEMRGFMPDVDGTGEDAPVGQVSFLTSSKGDGKLDKKTVFLDGLALPRALGFADGGVLVGAPPHLWFCRDTNGDGKADEKIEIASDFGVAVDPKRPEVANPERAPNSLLWGLDNWIYSAAYMARFRFDGGIWKRDLTTFRGQWGLSQDELGDLFYNSNSDQLRYDAIPAYYLTRNPDLPRLPGDNVNAADSQFVWPARVNPGINRGYRPEMLRNGRLKEFTAACAPHIFYSDLFPPDFYGNAFVAEPAGNLVRRNILSETNGMLRARNAYEKSEFLASTDERFRPVNFTTGPDGALYLVDLYRGVLQHRISLTTYLRNQSLERGLDKPIHLGRIFRIVPEGKQANPPVQAHFSRETPIQWVSHLSHSNSWWRYTAQRLLVEKRDETTVPALKSLALKGSNPIGRIHALRTLDGMKALELGTVESALKDSNPEVRAAAIRLCEPFFHAEEKPEVLDALLSLKSDSASAVQLQLALTLGEARTPQADLVLANLGDSPTPSPFMASAIISSLHGREFDLITHLLPALAWRKPTALHKTLLQDLAACVINGRVPQQVDALITLVSKKANSQQRQILLTGMVSTSMRTTKKPIKLSLAPVELAALQKSKEKATAQLANQLDSSLIWAGKPGVVPPPPLPALTAEQNKRFETGKQLFQTTCAACHQVHGMGMDGLAPPLADSEWVMGSEQRLVRILLSGLTGPVKVEGRSYYLDMPSMGVFNDDQIASILTYIRREWENTGSPVEPGSVKAIRAANAARQEAWNSAELLKIP
jgi:mono/diheme cytochrome c family protein